MFSFVGFAQEPNWVNHLPATDNNAFIYVREYAVGNSLNEARNQAIARIMQSTAMRIGQPFDSEKIFEALE